MHVKARDGVTGVYLSGSLRLWAYLAVCSSTRQDRDLLTERHSLGERRCFLRQVWDATQFLAPRFSLFSTL